MPDKWSGALTSGFMSSPTLTERRPVWRRFRRNKSALAGLILIGIAVF
ncbi:MAG: hypothetical protein EOO16_23320, partial [Chitinophagaceae bacterium]